MAKTLVETFEFKGLSDFMDHFCDFDPSESDEIHNPVKRHDVPKPELPVRLIDGEGQTLNVARLYQRPSIDGGTELAIMLTPENMDAVV